MWLTIIFTVILQLMIVYLPVAEPVFKTTALSWKEMSVLLIIFITSLIGFEIIKILTRRFQIKNNPAGGK
jgi:hypothetical protein